MLIESGQKELDLIQNYIFLHTGRLATMVESKENLGNRLKISSIGHNEAFHSIPLQILSHFDLNNIPVAQN